MVLAIQATDVERVALWAGLISSIVGIVLSVVAIVFAVLGSIRLEKVTDATIKSLQKIESDVANVHEQTSGLLKAGWEKMLVSVGNTNKETPATQLIDAKAIAAGLTDEIRSAIERVKEDTDEGKPENSKAWKRFEDTLKEVQTSLAAQMSSMSANARRSASLDERFLGLPADAKELAYQIRNRHLSRQEYKKLKSGSLGDALSALKGAGILIPVSAQKETGEEEQAYWFASRELLPTIVLSRPTDGEVQRSVIAELKRAGYQYLPGGSISS